MRIIDFGPKQSSPILDYGSRLAGAQRLADGTGEAHVYVVHLAAGGEIGTHLAGFEQLFLVVSGLAWVAGADGVKLRVQVGQGAVIARGERHAKGSEAGCTAIMIQLAELAPTAPPL